MSLQSYYPQKTTKTYLNFSAKDLKDQFNLINKTQKVGIKTRQMSMDVFLNQTLQELKDCLFWFIQIKITVQKGKTKRNYLPKATNKYQWKENL